MSKEPGSRSVDRQTRAHNQTLRRHAVQIAAQLPDETADAIRVLEYARQLVTGFLADDDGARPAAVRPRAR